MNKIAIIIPTYNGNQYLIPLLNSLLFTWKEGLFHIYLVNNGNVHNMDGLENPHITILQQTDNMGWEGGLKVGLESSKEELVLFLNDDTFIPKNSSDWLDRMSAHFKHEQIGAVGPSSNCVMGVQNIFTGIPYDQGLLLVNFLIGFCLMVRRSALEKAGGIDDTLSGGDDLDLSIRLRKVGYGLVCDRNVFVYHHGFKTGERVKGGPNTNGGWNSAEMIERTNWGLMEKHGLREWLNTMNQLAGILKEAA